MYDIEKLSFIFKKNSGVFSTESFVFN